MTSRYVCASLVAAALHVTLPIVSVTAQEPPATFRSAISGVRVDVAVLRNGRPLAGLRADEFEITDNGVAQKVSSLSYESWPIDVTVVFDVSQSVTGGTLRDLQRAVAALRADLRPQDRLKVITFNMRVKRIVDAGGDAAGTDGAFAAIRPAGSSAVFDALAVSLAAPAPPDRRQLIVLFSDGEDTSSITDPATLLDVARRTTPTVAAVLPAAPLNSVTLGRGLLPVPQFARMAYLQLTAATGGFVIETATGGVSSTFRRVLSDFRSSYVLHYVPAGVPMSGTHTIRVSVRRTGTFVRARQEYVVK